MPPIFLAALFTITNIWKQPICSLTDEWIKKVWNVVYVYIHTHTHAHIHTHNRILFSHKKEWNNAICNNMGGPKDYHTKWSKSERERPTPYHLCMESNIWHKWTYLGKRNRLIDIENGLVVANEGWGRKDWEFGISRCKSVYTGWINNKVHCIAQGTTFNILW